VSNVRSDDGRAALSDMHGQEEAWGTETR